MILKLHLMFSTAHRPTRHTSHIPWRRDRFGSPKNGEMFVCTLYSDHKRLWISNWNCWLPSKFRITILYRSQWTRGLRRGSAAARLLGLWVRISPVHWYLSLVSVVFCQVETSATGRSLLQRSHTECNVSECDLQASVMRRRWPSRGYCAMGMEGRKVTEL